MIDREKVLAVLDRRFPDAPRTERAAAANAIVGLDQEFEPVPGETVHGFRCETADGRYTTRDLTAGVLRIYRRRERTWDPAPARR
jgi:Ser/Thr protein kinase RdoA (MazF antagonist)